ncbi:glycosyltransferase [Tolypothrix campylonemoides VB511288]|nr:glycosyltransferase [Tolypothrix campylonemoides VB511288]
MKNHSTIHLGILYIGRKGGICHYTYELVRVISKMAKVTCYLSANNTLLEAWRELPCHIKTFETYNGLTSLLWSMLSRQNALRVAREIDVDAPDILLDTGSGPWLGIIQRNLCCSTLLADVIHDVKFHPGRWLNLLRAYEFLYPKKANVFIGISEYSYKQLSTHFRGAKCINSLHGIIHSTSNTDFDRIANNRNNLLFFGRIEKYKGIAILIEAFRIAKQKNPQLSLTIAGDGPLDSEIKKQILELNIELINKWISDADLQEIMTSKGVMILPYLSATQSGVAGVALGNGLPAISTNVGALPEQIIHNRNGLIVPPGDSNALAEAMVTISSDYMLAYKMAKEACLIAATMYSWEKIGSKLLTDLEALVSKTS